jgi:hypothetical protein
MQLKQKKPGMTPNAVSLYLDEAEALATGNGDCQMLMMALMVQSPKPKPVNRASWRKVKIDIEEITSGHTSGGSRVMPGSNKDLFPDQMSDEAILKAVQQAYRDSEIIRSKCEYLLLQGKSKSGLTIRMYYNKITKWIETAWPKW